MGVDKRGRRTDSRPVDIGGALGRALRQKNVSNAALGRQIGIDGSNVGRLITGENAMSLAQVRAAEDALELPRGWLLVDGGYVDHELVGIPSTEAAIRTDPALDDDARDLLSRTYRRYLPVPPPTRRSR